MTPKLLEIIKKENKKNNNISVWIGVTSYSHPLSIGYLYDDLNGQEGRKVIMDRTNPIVKIKFNTILHQTKIDFFYNATQK